MTLFKTVRGEVLSRDNCHRFKATPSLKRIALAASDYENAMHRPEFAQANGGLEALRHDLLQFVREWYLDLGRQDTKVQNRKKAKSKAKARIAATAPKYL